MKVTKLIVENLGPIEPTSIDLNKPLLLFYGEIRQGKSTLLNAVKWCLGAAWPEDIIRHGEAEGKVTLEFVGGSVSRSWYRGKDGSTKARDIALVMNGVPVSKPVKELAKFLNPFLLDQDHLSKMSEPERKAFFADILAVDTQNLDTESSVLESNARDLRAELKAYGDINPVVPPATPPNVEDLRAKLDMLKSDYQTELNQNRAHNEAVHTRAGAIQSFELKKKIILQRIDRLEKDIVEAREELDAVSVLLANNPPLEHVAAPIAPEEIGKLELQISDAAAARVKFEQWQKDRARLDSKIAKEGDLKNTEARLRAIKTEKASLLKSSTENCGVPGLAFDDAGNVIYEDTQAGMLSTSQLMKLSSALSALYPPGFGLDLIDRAESLGESIFTFIERAKRDDRTILASIVGDAPAKSPPEVGVFVVKKGKVKQKELL